MLAFKAAVKVTEREPQVSVPGVSLAFTQYYNYHITGPMCLPKYGRAFLGE